MPNSFLLDSHKKVVAFGYEAENQYYDLVREDNHHDCYFFKQFTKDIYKLQVRLLFIKINYQTIKVVIKRLYTFVVVSQVSY